MKPRCTVITYLEGLEYPTYLSGIYTDFLFLLESIGSIVPTSYEYRTVIQIRFGSLQRWEDLEFQIQIDSEAFRVSSKLKFKFAASHGESTQSGSNILTVDPLVAPNP